MKYCCKDFEKQIELYDERSDGIAWLEGKYVAMAEGALILFTLIFCPFCGKDLNRGN
jgi:hypothetical protein